MTKYRTKFLADARVVAPSKSLKKEAMASLQNLKGLFPQNFNPEKSPSLLFIASQLVALDKTNANGVATPRAVALKSRDSWAYQLLDVEHNREKLVGCIINAAFADAVTSETVPDDKVLDYPGELMLVYSACVWKVANPKLASFLSQVSNPKSDYYNSVSSSFEVGYNEYDIMVSSTIEMRDGKIISAEDREEYSKFLLENGGKNKDEKGNYVFVVLKDLLPLGAGLVSRPASQVKGLITIEKMLETMASEDEEDEDDEDEDEMDEECLTTLSECCEDEECEVEMEDGSKVSVKVKNKKLPSYIKPSAVKKINRKKPLEEKTANINIQTQNSCVTQNIIMKIEKLEDITPELFKNETLASEMTKFIQDAIAKASEAFVAEKNKLEAEKAEIEQKRAEAVAQLEKLQANVADLAGRLNEIETAKASEEKSKLFNERMAGFDAEFDLSDEERAFIAADIAELSQEQFDAYAAKAKVMWKEKSKCFKKEKEEMMKKKAAEAGVTMEFTAADISFKQVVANTKETVQSTLENGPSVVETDLGEKMKNAFSAQNIKVNGKPVSAS